MEPANESVRPRILLVEDTLTQAMLMQHQLKRAGYRVKLVRSGAAALAEIEEESYELILSDIHMPGMSGLELCREIKSAEKWKNMLVILLATPVEKIEIVRMLESKADNFILKTYDEMTFLAKLEDIISTDRLRRSSACRSKSVYAGSEIEIQQESPALADFMLSSFELYLFQLAKSAESQADS